jgi:hypothetical protein
MWPWLHNLLIVGGPSVVAALAATAGLWKWLGQKWVDHRLEKYKAEQGKELARLQHLLSSRISRIHEKEFEVLPKAWAMLHELQGWVALALDLTLKRYPDFTKLSDPDFDHFLTDKRGAPSLLSDYHKEKLRKATDRNKYFAEAMAEVNLDEANEKQRLFQNYLIENRIFMTDDLRKQFGDANDALSTALHSYEVGRKHIQSGLTISGQREVSRLKDIIDKVELAVQKRLHYEDA